MAKAGLTPKQSKFVEEYLLNAHNACAAYRVAYNCERMKEHSILQCAAQLLRHPDIAFRVAQADLAAATAVQVASNKAANALAIAAEEQGVTKSWVSGILRDLARGQGVYEDERIPSRVRESAAMDLARLHGMVVEKRDIRMIKSLTDLSDEELAALMAEEERKTIEGKVVDG